MCGFVGFIASRDFPQLKDELYEASAGLNHRGPDDSGVFFDAAAGVGLAHRRLSVIDLTSAGRQPMASDDGKLHIVYNGEVYNFQKIRRQLEAHGVDFHSATDTEVVLKAYEWWGADCLHRLVGMFALAIWDGKTQSLFFARDRLGIKPLYYYDTGEVFLFASELKALMAFSGFVKEIDFDALSLYFHYQYIPAPKTIFKKTFKLPPGYLATVSNRRILSSQYWRLPEAPISVSMDETQTLDALEDLLTTAVKDRLISDVPLGVLLSGGVDSSLVTALIQKAGAGPVKTFTIGFSDPEYDESAWAGKVATYLNTEHTYVYVTPKDAMAVIPKLTEIFDEPFADASAIPTILVSRLARSKVTVALSGDGGDEPFSGYVRYWTILSLIKLLKKIPRSLAPVFQNVSPDWIEKAYRPLRSFFPQRFQINNFYDKWNKLVQSIGQTELSEIYRMSICVWTPGEISLLLGKALPKSRYEAAFEEMRGLSPLSQLMRVDMETYLPDAMLTKVDRASMAASLEVRVPLLDHRVVEYAATIPEGLKYRNGTGKYVLKKLLSRYLPEHLINRPKMGFGVPIGAWFRTELKEMVLDYLTGACIKRTGLINSDIIEKALKEHFSGRVNHQDRLWSLLAWQMWYEQWMEN